MTDDELVVELDEEHDVSSDPDLDLSRFPQDAQARRPGELLRAWFERICAELPRD